MRTEHDHVHRALRNCLHGETMQCMLASGIIGIIIIITITV